MAKDRAAPFSRKHRRYWIPVTGGMIVIGLVNVGLGLCSYKAPQDVQRIELGLRRDAGFLDAPGSIGAAQLPADVMRAFAVKYPHVLPAGVRREGDGFVIAFPPGADHKYATFDGSGAFVSEQ